jgi:hypothetical protein
LRDIEFFNAMTLFEIFEIEREIATNPPLPDLTVKRLPASNPDQIWLLLEWRERDKSRSHMIREFSDYHEWKSKLALKAENSFCEVSSPGAVTPREGG